MTEIKSVSKIMRGEGQFDYFGSSQANVYRVAFQAINNLDHWDFVANGIGNKKIWSECLDPRINEIFNEIIRLGYNEHDESSFCITMRVMEYIARYGEEWFVQKVGFALEPVKKFSSRL